MDWQEKLRLLARQRRQAALERPSPLKHPSKTACASTAPQKASMSTAGDASARALPASNLVAPDLVAPDLAAPDWRANVTPLNSPARVTLEKQKPSPRPIQREMENQNVLRESLSDDFDVDSLLETDAALSYRADGVGPDVLKRLRRGHWALQAELDLHGLRRDEARAALSEFIRAACAAGLRCVRVIHGKGLGSENKTPILKSRAPSWLVQKREVMAFVQARPADGGSGALVVLLRGKP